MTEICDDSVPERRAISETVKSVGSMALDAFEKATQVVRFETPAIRADVLSSLVDFAKGIRKASETPDATQENE